MCIERALNYDLFKSMDGINESMEVIIEIKEYLFEIGLVAMLDELMAH